MHNKLTKPASVSKAQRSLLNFFSDPETYGTFLATLSAILFGLMSFFGTKLIQHDFPVGNMLFWRFAIASIWMLFIILLTGKKIPAGYLTTRSALHTLFFAAILYSTASSLFFISTKSLGTGLAMAVFFSFPLFVTAFSCVFDRWKLDRYSILALASITFGILLIEWHNTGEANIIGIALALLAAFFYASYVYCNRLFAKLVDPYFLTLLVCFGNMTIFFIFSYSTHRFFVPPTLLDWFYICTLGVLATALPIQLLLESLKYIRPVKAAMLASLEVIVTLFIGLLFLEETASWVQLLGVLTILLGAISVQQAD